MAKSRIVPSISTGIPTFITETNNKSVIRAGTFINEKTSNTFQANVISIISATFIMMGV